MSVGRATMNSLGESEVSYSIFPEYLQAAMISPNLSDINIDKLPTADTNLTSVKIPSDKEIFSLKETMHGQMVYLQT